MKKQIKFELPDHSEELAKANDFLIKIEKDLKWYKDTNVEIPYTKKRTLVYIADTVLGVVGDLSQSIFDLRDKMDEEYKMSYLKAPELGKTLFLEHYHSLHEKYDYIKNKAFDLLMRLDPTATIIETI